MPGSLRELPAHLPPAVWRANELGSSPAPAWPSGLAGLDAQLPGGGWPTGALTELIARDAGIGELRLVVPLLRWLTAQQQVVLLVTPPHVPYAPALAAFGVDPAWVILVQATDASERLWAIEQVLKSGAAGTVLAWLPHGTAGPAQLRRLQVAASTAAGVAFIFRPLPARFQPSPAPLRLVLEPLAGERLSVRIAKRRGPPLAQPLVLELPASPDRTALHHGKAWAEAVQATVPEPRTLGTLMVPHPLLPVPQGHAPLH